MIGCFARKRFPLDVFVGQDDFILVPWNKRATARRPASGEYSARFRNIGRVVKEFAFGLTRWICSSPSLSPTRGLGLLIFTPDDRGQRPHRLHPSATTCGDTRVAKLGGLALGYEDVADHDDLRFDPVLALFSDRWPRLVPTKPPSPSPTPACAPRQFDRTPLSRRGCTTPPTCAHQDSAKWYTP